MHVRFSMRRRGSMQRNSCLRLAFNQLCFYMHVRFSFLSQINSIVVTSMCRFILSWGAVYVLVASGFNVAPPAFFNPLCFCLLHSWPVNSSHCACNFLHPCLAGRG